MTALFLWMQARAPPAHIRIAYLLEKAPPAAGPRPSPPPAARAQAYSKLLGYQRGANGQPEIVPEEAETVKRIFRLYLDGYSEDRIKKLLTDEQVPTASGIKGWSHQVIHNILTNERYIGDGLLGKTFVTDCISKKVKKNKGERSMERKRKGRHESRSR